MFKFIHAADLHLDSPLRGLAHYEGAPAARIRGAAREAFQGLVRTAIDEAAAFVVIAGDVFDGDWRDYNTGLFFARQMSLLRQAGIRVFLASGNHDAASVISRSLEMPDNVHRFTSRAPETVRVPDIRAALHGQGFSRPDVTEDLSAGYPPAEAGYYNIGVLHTSADGREGHAPYAPCAPRDLARKGYDYWALGHVHRHEILSRSPWIVFPGNIQGRHIRETGPRGCALVTVDEGGDTHLEHRPMDVVRWSALEVDCAGSETPEAVVRSIRAALAAAVETAGPRLLAARLRITGTGPAHGPLTAEWPKWVNQIRAEATDVGRGEVWIEKIILDSRAAVDMAGVDTSRGPIAELLAYIREAAGDPAQLAVLAAGLEELAARLPAELVAGEDALELQSPAWLSRRVAEIPATLLPRLLQSEGGQ